MKVIRVTNYDVADDKLLRCKCKIGFLNNKIKEYFITHPHFFLVRDLFDIISGYAFLSKDYVQNGIPLIRIGDLNNDFSVDNTVYLPDEYFDEYSKFQIKPQDILVSLTGDGNLKTAFMSEGNMLLNQRVAILRAKKCTNTKVYYYLLNCEIVRSQFEFFSNGKSQLNISPNDFGSIKVPYLTDKQLEHIGNAILPIEESIKKEKAKITTHQGIIDKVFSVAFKINSNFFREIAKEKAVVSKSSDLAFNNTNIRFSFRWDKAVAIQEKLIEMCEDCKRLDRYILSTKNGWSPECSESATLYRVLGIDAIQKSAKLALENVKFTDQIDKSVELNTVKNGDFFVSRGNTTDLVALASVADIPEEDEEPIIFPDLMIRVDFNEHVNKLYMAYAFNSFIGRLYFKYVSKGKNQTMVKISQKELKDFYVPIPSLDVQQHIVEEIQAEIYKQNVVKAEIAKQRGKIDSIIEETIKE